MKKLLLDSCAKTAFSYDNVIYQKCDVVSMGSSLVPVLVNIILAEFEKVVMPLMKSGILKFYCRYVDDTLRLVKEDQIGKIWKTFNSFHNNWLFTVDKFEKKDVHFLDFKSYEQWWNLHFRVATPPQISSNLKFLLKSPLIFSKNVNFQENLKSPQIQKKENSILAISLLNNRVFLIPRTKN